MKKLLIAARGYIEKKTAEDADMKGKVDTLVFIFATFVISMPVAQAQIYEHYSYEARKKYTDSNRKQNIKMVVLYFQKGSDLPNYPTAHGRIVLKRLGDNKTILNPSNEPLGWSRGTVEILKIVKRTAIEEFEGIENNDGSVSCKLLTDYRNPKSVTYFLDLKFVDDKVSFYRLRGPGITEPVWVTEEQTGER